MASAKPGGEEAGLVFGWSDGTSGGKRGGGGLEGGEEAEEEEGKRTVVSGGVLEAAGVVEEFVADEAVVGLHDDGVLVPVVLPAVAVLADLQREGVHQVAACGEGDVAGGVEGLGDADDGFGGCEEGVGVLGGC